MTLTTKPNRSTVTVNRIAKTSSAPVLAGTPHPVLIVVPAGAYAIQKLFDPKVLLCRRMGDTYGLRVRAIIVIESAFRGTNKTPPDLWQKEIAKLKMRLVNPADPIIFI